MRDDELKRLGGLHDATPGGKYERDPNSRIVRLNGRAIAAGIPLHGTSGDPAAASAIVDFLIGVHDAFPALLAEVRRLRSLTESIGRDALLELPAVEEAIRQERQAVLRHLRAAAERMRGDEFSPFNVLTGAADSIEKGNHAEGEP